MIDLHCHLLPGIDDGPPTMEATLALARAAVAGGTTTIVATPHVSWDYQANTAVSIAAGVTAVQQALQLAGIALEVRTGAEIAMTRAADLDDEELVALRLGGPTGTHLLVECPLSPSVAGFDGLLGLLRARGHAILLAHPERCPAFQRDPDAYARLIDQGMLGQVTAGSLVGRFGRIPQELGDRMVRDGLVQVIGSDAHSADRRIPSMRAELEEAGFGAQADWLTGDVPRGILDGRPLPAAPEMPPAPARGLRRLLRR